MALLICLSNVHPKCIIIEKALHYVDSWLVQFAYPPRLNPFHKMTPNLPNRIMASVHMTAGSLLSFAPRCASCLGLISIMHNDNIT